MAIIDFYAESNQNAVTSLSDAASHSAGQSFTGDGNDLHQSTFYIKKINSPTGNILSRLYAHSGTFGTDSEPTGAALASSDTIDVSTLSTSLALVDFDFSTPFTLVDGTKYCINCEYTGGDATNRVDLGADTSSSTHAGNLFNTPDLIVWSTFATFDGIFYTRTELLNTVSDRFSMMGF